MRLKLRQQWNRRSWIRVFDALSAAAGLVLLTPLFLVLALLVVCIDGRPIFFGQIRTGRQGRRFRMWKFRSMRTGSRGITVTAAGDCRVTRLGAFLRKFKLDELPQLFNVLKGDMSLVGPRPEVPEYVQLDAPIWRAVLDVRPGITDLASLVYRNEEQILGASPDPETTYRNQVLPAKLLLNLAYLRSRTFAHDLRMILLTIRYSILPQKIDPDSICRTFTAGAGIHE